MKKLVLFLVLFSFYYLSSAQRLIEHEKIDETFYSVTSQTYNTLSEITINISEPGKVVLTMAGTVDSSVGDDIILAASEDESWSSGPGQVIVQALSSVDDHSSFSHMMVYEVEPGEHTFYALAGRTGGSTGTGSIDLDATFLVEFTSDSAPGNIDYTEVSSFLIYDNDHLLNLNNYQFTPEVDGRLIVKFSGHATVPYGENFAMINSVSELTLENDWYLNNSFSQHIITPSSTEANRSSFTYSRSYPVAENVPFESYTYVINEVNLFALGSINGIITYEFIPNEVYKINTHQSLSYSSTSYPDASEPTFVSSLIINSRVDATAIIQFSGYIHNETIGKTTFVITTDPDNYNPSFTEEVQIESSIADPNQEISFINVVDIDPGINQYYVYFSNPYLNSDQSVQMRKDLSLKIVSEAELGACESPFHVFYLDPIGAQVVVQNCQPIYGTAVLNSACSEEVFNGSDFCTDPQNFEYCMYYYNECLEDVGCTYPDASNYDSNAIIDDGSCILESGYCPSDINGDGFITTGDLTIFLSDFGSECSD